MSLNGVFSGFETRALTQHELRNLADFDVVWLTPDEDQWDLYKTSFAERESTMRTLEGNVVMHDPYPTRTTPSTLNLFGEISQVIAEGVDHLPSFPTVDEYEKLVNQVGCDSFYGDRVPDSVEERPPMAE